MAWKSSVLVVANQTADSPELIQTLRERTGEGDAEFTLLLPRLPGRREEAAKRLDEIVEAWGEAGLDAHGELGDTDPVSAVKDAWDPGRFDEVIISTLPTGASKWLQVDLPHRVERLTGAPVRHVVGTAAKQEDEASPPADTSAQPPVRKPPGLEHWLGAPRRKDA